MATFVIGRYYRPENRDVFDNHLPIRVGWPVIVIVAPDRSGRATPIE